MIEEVLLNYGVLGLWTLSLIIERMTNNKQMKKVIESNTAALIKVHDCLERRKHGK